MTVSSFTVMVNAPTTTTVPAVAGQYSDQVTLKANVTNSVCPGGAVEFKVNGAIAGSSPVIGGMASLPYTISLAHGNYPIMATYSSSSPGTGSSGSVTLAVAKEDAIVTPAATNPKSVKVNTPGGTAGPIVLCAAINEPSDGSPGDISKATPVTFTLTPIGPGSVITQTATTSGGGIGGTLTACVTLNNVPVNAYNVGISVGGDFYAGTASASLVVFDTTLGAVTGGGTIIHNGVKASFEFDVQFTTNGVVQGNLTYIEPRPTGTVTLQSTAMQALVVAGNTGLFFGTATINGAGSYTFRVIVVDNGEPGRRDQFGLQVTGSGGAIVPDLTFNPITINGGNIQVHKPNSAAISQQRRKSNTALKQKAVGGDRLR
jgi:hypothetical protein